MTNHRKLLLFLCGILVITQNRGLSQTVNYNYYSPLKCSGAVPEDFLKPSYKKYDKEVEKISKNQTVSKKDRKLQIDFALLTSYKVDEILMSGKVLYGNKVSDYINEVASKLLVNEPDLKSKMRFYLLNVPYANAFATNNGIVMVTTGLIAQLENEAQLAFVLSHEISHFKLSHSFESYKKSQDILTGKKYDDLGTDEKMVKILKYSKEHEAEADVEGLKIFAKAGYDKNESIKMMDILLYSYLPFDEIPFPKDFFNDSFYKLPMQYFPDSASPISAVEDEDDEENSHPNIDFRKSNLRKYIKGEKGELNFFGKEKFDEVVKICRYEMGFLLIVRGSYIKAFYHAYLLSQTYGETTYGSELLMASMYGMNKWKQAMLRNDEDEEIKSDDKNYEGEISVPYHLFMSMKQDEFNILSSKYINQLYSKTSTNYAYKVMCDSYIDLLYAHKYTTADFNIKAEVVEAETSEVEKDSVKEVPKTDVKIRKNFESKVRKIKKSKKISQASSNTKYYKNAFVMHFKSVNFTSFFDSIDRCVIALKKVEEDLGLSQLRSEPERRYRQMLSDENKTQRKKGKALGIDSIIIFAPSFSAVYYDYEEIEAKIDNMSDEKKSIEMTKFIQSMSESLNLNVNIIDINQRQTLSSEQLNRFSAISSWVTEKYSHSDKADPLFSQKYIDTLIEQDGYKNVCLTGFSYKSVKRMFDATVVVYSLILWPSFPFVMSYQADTDKKLDYFNVVLDMKTGEQKMLVYRTIKRRPKAKILNMQMGYTLYQIKAKSKR
jgi:hypothetical protein